jgi:hypothetical protein
MISANLKSNQEAKTFLGKIQAMEERKSHKENYLETKQIFERGETRRQEIAASASSVPRSLFK